MSAYGGCLWAGACQLYQFKERHCSGLLWGLLKIVAVEIRKGYAFVEGSPHGLNGTVENGQSPDRAVGNSSN
jgi:hypothetical protein